MPKNPTYKPPKLNHNQIRKTQNDPVWFAKNILAANPWKNNAKSSTHSPDTNSSPSDHATAPVNHTPPQSQLYGG